MEDRQIEVPEAEEAVEEASAGDADAHAEWLERVKADEQAEADAKVRRDAQAAHEAEVAEQETAMQQAAAAPADEDEAVEPTEE
jgi:hypothetical protein